MSAEQGTKPFNSSCCPSVREYALAAAYTLSDIQETLEVLASCIGSLYREDTLPEKLIDLLPDPSLASTAQSIADSTWAEGCFNISHNPTPERFWPGYLFEAVIASKLDGTFGVKAGSDLCLNGDQSKLITEVDNDNFSVAEMNCQIDAAVLIKAHLEPFVDGAVEFFREALKIEGPLNMAVVETVYNSVLAEDPELIAENPLGWFVQEYHALQEVDGFADFLNHEPEAEDRGLFQN